METMQSPPTLPAKADMGAKSFYPKLSGKDLRIMQSSKSTMEHLLVYEQKIEVRAQLDEQVKKGTAKLNELNLSLETTISVAKNTNNTQRMEDSLKFKINHLREKIDLANTEIQEAEKDRDVCCAAIANLANSLKETFASPVDTTPAQRDATVKELICELSLPQCQQLIYNMLVEKIELQENLSQFHRWLDRTNKSGGTSAAAPNFGKRKSIESNDLIARKAAKTSSEVATGNTSSTSSDQQQQEQQQQQQLEDLIGDVLAVKDSIVADNSSSDEDGEAGEQRVASLIRRVTAVQDAAELNTGVDSVAAGTYASTTPSMWTEKMDNLLKEAYQIYARSGKKKNPKGTWAQIAAFVGNNVTNHQCQNRWSRYVDPALSFCKASDTWTEEEMEELREVVAQNQLHYGPNSDEKLAISTSALAAIDGTQDGDLMTEATQHGNVSSATTASITGDQSDNHELDTSVTKSGKAYKRARTTVNWTKVAAIMKRTATDVQRKYDYLSKLTQRRGCFTPEEDYRICEQVERFRAEHGPDSLDERTSTHSGPWRDLSKQLDRPAITLRKHWEKILRNKSIDTISAELQSSSRWSQLEIESLQDYVVSTGIANVQTDSMSAMCMGRLAWKPIAEKLGRSADECMHKFRNLQYSKMKKGLFQKYEDDLILQRVEEWGEHSSKKKGLWTALEKELGRPDRNIAYRYRELTSKKGPFTPEEDAAIVQRVQQFSQNPKSRGLWTSLEKDLGRHDRVLAVYWKDVLSKQHPHLRLPYAESKK